MKRPFTRLLVSALALRDAYLTLFSNLIHQQIEFVGEEEKNENITTASFL